jgi:hypothetical protein
MHQLAVNHLFVAPATMEPHVTQHRPFAVEMQQVALTDHVLTGHHGLSLTFGPASADAVLARHHASAGKRCHLRHDDLQM